MHFFLTEAYERIQRFANLSLGRAVHARLWDVPAEICWTATPSKPITFLGLVMGPVEFPWPHWPMELFPQAYTSLSLSKTCTEKKKNYLTIFPNTHELHMFCSSIQRQIVMCEAPTLHLIWVWVSTYPSATNLTHPPTHPPHTHTLSRTTVHTTQYSPKKEDSQNQQHLITSHWLLSLQYTESEKNIWRSQT